MTSSRRRHRSYDDSLSKADSDSGPHRPPKRLCRRCRRRHRCYYESSSEAVSVPGLHRPPKRACRWNSDSDSDQPPRLQDKSNVTYEEIKKYISLRAKKKALEISEKLKSLTVSGYSNDSSPSGDANLNEKFVRGKKIESDVSHGVLLGELPLKAEKNRQRERKAEIEKVKKRREESAVEKGHHEKEMVLLARERTRAEFQDWEQKEEEFHFDKKKFRSEIRLCEGRTKPKYFELDLNEPYMVFEGMTVKSMEEHYSDIQMRLNLGRATPLRVKYWEALLVVLGWELAEARKKDALERAMVCGESLPPEMIGEEKGLHSSIEADVRSLLQGKTYTQLEALQSQIESQMRSGTSEVVEYWEAAIKHLHIYKAKACLKETHAQLLRKFFETHAQSDQDTDELQNEDELAGSYSPQLFDDDEAIDPEEDKGVLERKHISVKENRPTQEMSSRPAPTENNFERSAIKVMGTMEEGDAVFGSNDEINLDTQVYWWQDKYRPIKPKYFNRVHTGNKYNQAHYDHDNPPPKVVQGYKFNIFYPNLVDKSKTPAFIIEKDGASTETCIIRFRAGPPYKDIAFRIVNKKWADSHKMGFKCSFERGILHVYFNFMRFRYSR